MEQENILAGLSLGLGSLIGYFAGLDWELFFIWFLIMCIDVLLGVMFAGKDGEYKSETNSCGLYKKIAETLVLFALILVQRVALKYGINVPISSSFTVLFVFKDIGSIFETLATHGVALPPQIIEWYEKSSESLEVKRREERE